MEAHAPFSSCLCLYPAPCRVLLAGMWTPQPHIQGHFSPDIVITWKLVRNA